jgi:orotate phosphoribosyltransferase
VASSAREGALEFADAGARESFLGRGAIREGHFKLSSGLHSPFYVQCQAVLAFPADAERLCRLLAARFAGERIAAVVGPAIGAIVLAHETARALGCRSLFAERAGQEASGTPGASSGKFDLRRGQSLEAGERVLLVENVVTTGGSVAETIELVRARGGEPVGVAALVSRLPQGARPFGDLRFEALCRADVPAFEAASCPLCARGLALESPGSRHRGG